MWGFLYRPTNHEDMPGQQMIGFHAPILDADYCPILGIRRPDKLELTFSGMLPRTVMVSTLFIAPFCFLFSSVHLIIL